MGLYYVILVLICLRLNNWSQLKNLYHLNNASKAKLPDDGNDFNALFSKLKAEFEAQLKEEARLNALIVENLGKVKLIWERDLGSRWK